MNTHSRWKYVEWLPVENESTPRVTTCAAHYEFVMCTQKKTV